VNDVEVKFGAQLGELKNGIAEAVSSLKTLTSPINAIKEHFVGLTAIFGGGKLFKEVIQETVNWQRETTRLSRALGETVEMASVYNTAMGNIFLTSDDLVRAANAMTTRLRTNEQSFRDLGIQTRDAQGHLRGTMDIMRQSIDILSQYKEGTDRNIIGQRLFGRQWRDIVDIMRLTNEVMAEAADENEKLNLTMTPDKQTIILAYRKSMEGVSKVFEGISISVGQALMPLLTDLAQWFRAIGPTAVQVFKVTMESLVGLAYAFVLGLQTIWYTGKAAFLSLGDIILGFANAAQLALSFKFSAAKDVMVSAADQAKKRWIEAYDGIEKAAEKANSKISAMITGKPNETAKELVGGGPGKGNKHAGEEVTQKQKEMLIDTLRDARIAALEREKIDVESAHNAAMASLDEKRKQLDQDKALELKTAAEIFAAKQLLLNEQSRLEEDKLNKLAAIEQQKLQAELDALNQKQRYYEHDRDKFEELEKQKEKIQQQSLTSVAKFEAEKQKIRLKYNTEAADLERKTIVEMKGRYESIIGGIVSTFTNGLQQMMKGQLSFKKFISQLGWSIVDEAIAQGVKIVVNAATTEAARVATAEAGGATRVAVEETTAIKSVALASWAAIKQILMSAWVVAANVYRSVSAIPFVGWILAPIMAVAAAATVAGYVKRIASAAGGWKVPSDQLAMVHQDEMILPAHLSKGIEAMVASGKAGGGGNVTLNVSALDGASVAKFLQRNAPALARVARGQARNFTPRPA
jgi:hypothetical protein